VQLWVRIFLVCVAISLAAVAVIGLVSLRTGYRAVLRDAVAGLERETAHILSTIEMRWESVRELARVSPDAGLLPPESLGSLPDYLRLSGSELVDESTQVELRFVDLGTTLAAGTLFEQLDDAHRPELEIAARGGAAYRLHRQGGRLALYVSSAARLSGYDVLISVASDQSALDAFWRTQVSVLAVASLAAALVLTAASFAASRLVARRLEALAVQAGRVSEGDYEGRADETGGDEIADLAARLNRMAEAVEKSVATLRAEREDRQRFIDALTHELRTPVASIVGFAKLLRLRSWDEEVFPPALDRIRTEGERILSLAESLKRLLLVRCAETGLREVDIGHFLAEVAEEAGRRAGGHELTLEIEADRGSVTADPDLLEMAMLNLVDNAARYTPPGSPIVLGFRSADGERTVYVRDFGPGMSDAEIARAGEPFFRGSMAHEGDGFGLGLAICRDTAAHHGARIVFERPPAGGFLVGIAFPNLPGVYRRETKR